MKIIISESQARKLFNLLSEDSNPNIYNQLQKLGQFIGDPASAIAGQLGIDNQYTKLAKQTQTQGQPKVQPPKDWNLTPQPPEIKSDNTNIQRTIPKLDIDMSKLPELPDEWKDKQITTTDTKSYYDVKVINFFREKGLTPEQSAGILGNLYQESQLDPNAVGDNGASYGIAQWQGSRRKELEKQPNWNSVDGQLNFIWKELLSTERKAFNYLKNTFTPRDSALTFSYYYERPSTPHNEKRVAYANNSYQNYVTIAKAQTNTSDKEQS